MGQLMYDLGIACFVLAFFCGLPVTTSTFGVRRLSDDGPALVRDEAGHESKAACPDEYTACPRREFMQLMATRGLLQLFALTSSALGLVFIRLSPRL
jgi:hypothetical protein